MKRNDMNTTSHKLYQILLENNRFHSIAKTHKKFFELFLNFSFFNFFKIECKYLENLNIVIRDIKWLKMKHVA